MALDTKNLLSNRYGAYKDPAEVESAPLPVALEELYEPTPVEDRRGRETFVRTEFVTELGVDANTALRMTLASRACGVPFIGERRAPAPAGPTFLDVSTVKTPYVPLAPADDTMTVRKGLRSRFGKEIVRSDYYGTVPLLDGTEKPTG